MPLSLKTVGSFLLLVLLGSCKEQASAGSKIEPLDLANGVTIATIDHDGSSWQVVTVDPSKSKPSFRLSDPSGKPLRDFSTFEKAAQKANETIVWMMNAGMYHKGGFPVGLCIVDGLEITPVNTSDGEGNFFLQPNGIFFLTKDGAQIIETNEWDPTIAPDVQGATQSGPLLVRQDILHPAIRPNSPNKLIRNGVGVRRDGHLCFAISITPVSFHEMAIFLRDQLNCSDALYLDGTVSALYAPGAGLRPEASGLGPVIGLWQ